MVYLPKHKGGLGVLNLKVQNEALLLKHLHKFSNHHDTPWVSLIWDSYYHNKVPHATDFCGSFWWRDIFKLAHVYCQFAQPNPLSGSSIMFWTDTWSLDNSIVPLKERFPRLLSFVIDGLGSNQETLSVDLISHFHLPLSAEAYQEFLNLQQLLEYVQLSDGVDDVWKWPFNKGEYRPKSFYTVVHAHIVVDPIFSGYGNVLTHSRSKCLGGFC